MSGHFAPGNSLVLGPFTLLIVFVELGKIPRVSEHSLFEGFPWEQAPGLSPQRVLWLLQGFDQSQSSPTLEMTNTGRGSVVFHPSLSAAALMGSAYRKYKGAKEEKSSSLCRRRACSPLTLQHVIFKTELL